MGRAKRKLHSEIESGPSPSDFKLTPAQKQFVNQIALNDLIFCRGPSGTGKTFSAFLYAVQEYNKGNYDKIIVVRSPVENADRSSQIGFLSGDYDDKIEIHMQSSRRILEEIMGKGRVDCAVKAGNIEFLIPNYMLGSTIKGICILDEMQMVTPLVMKMILERIGIDTKFIVLGDQSQVYNTDVKRNGLNDAISRLFIVKDGALVPKYPRIGYYEFDSDSVCRSEMAKNIVKAYSD